ncbi:MAG: hypothetical protein IPN17_31965 [Deltaproteobacteria bacterium]|nr:hypothetical protein [Deltaproteobacteria bacterium]
MNTLRPAILLLALLPACGRRQHQGPPVEAAVVRPVTVDVPARSMCPRWWMCPRRWMSP